MSNFKESLEDLAKLEDPTERLERALLLDTQLDGIPDEQTVNDLEVQVGDLTDKLTKMTNSANEYRAKYADLYFKRDPGNGSPRQDPEPTFKSLKDRYGLD